MTFNRVSNPILVDAENGGQLSSVSITKLSTLTFTLKGEINYEDAQNIMAYLIYASWLSCDTITMEHTAQRQEHLDYDRWATPSDKY